MVMLSGYWGHGATAVMAVIGTAWMRIAARPQAEAEERRMAEVLEFPAPKLASEFEVFVERARLLG